MRRPVVGVSLKMYFSLAQARAWLRAARAVVPSGGRDAGVEFFVAPSYLALPDAVALFPDATAAQDVAADERGPSTGEVSAEELAEAGVAYAIVGHAERRTRFGETDAVVAAKTAAALRHGLTPVLCVGEARRMSAAAAADAAAQQLERALADAPAGRMLVAYEPLWAIGAERAAPDEHIRAVCAALREARRGEDDAVLYGGAAGPGLLERLGGAAGGAVDGLFLGRSAHDPAGLAAVLHEAVATRPFG